MKLLTFRKRGALLIRVGALSISGEVIDLTAAYTPHLHKKSESNSTGLAQTLIPVDMEFIGGGRASL
jgi:hypothetical protein